MVSGLAIKVWLWSTVLCQSFWDVVQQFTKLFLTNREQQRQQYEWKVYECVVFYVPHLMWEKHKIMVYRYICALSTVIIWMQTFQSLKLWFYILSYSSLISLKQFKIYNAQVPHWTLNLIFKYFINSFCHYVWFSITYILPEEILYKNNATFLNEKDNQKQWVLFLLAFWLFLTMQLHQLIVLIITTMMILHHNIQYLSFTGMLWSQIQCNC